MSGNARISIAHVINRLDVGGLENGVVNLINGLPAERFRHAVICLSGYSEVFRRRISRPDVPVLSMNKKPGKDISVYWRMWRVLRELRPDIVHTRNLGTIDMQAVAMLAGVPRRVHGEHGWEASDPLGSSRRNLRIRRTFSGCIHMYVPMSLDISHWLERSVGIPNSKIVQLYNGVDVARFSPVSKRLSSGAVVIGTVGRLDPVKNQLALIRAFRSVVDQVAGRFELKLVIAGDGPMRARLEELTLELGLNDRVTFTGPVTNVPSLMRDLDVFVLPSLNEGISNTILEAMASGVPVVASAVGGNPELVVPGQSGELYDPTVDGALERALIGYVIDQGVRAAHGAAARQRVLEKFSLEAMLIGYSQMYSSLQAGRVPPKRSARDVTLSERKN